MTLLGRCLTLARGNISHHVNSKNSITHNENDHKQVKYRHKYLIDFFSAFNDLTANRMHLVVLHDCFIIGFKTITQKREREKKLENKPKLCFPSDDIL